MNMKKILIILVLSCLCFGCSRDITWFKRSFQTKNRNYHIWLYSGGKLIAEYKFSGILNNQESSDGYYFYKDDKLIEIGGDIIIESNS
jgi:hypothetical protein